MTSTTNPDIDLEIQKLLLIFQRRWKLGVGIVILSLVLSAIAALQKRPQSQAVAKLLFKNSGSSELIGVEKNINKFESLEMNANPIVSEIEIIKSAPLAQKTIADLNLTDSSGEILSVAVFLDNLETKPLPGSDVVTISYQHSDPHTALQVVDRTIDNYLEQNHLNNRKNVTTAIETIEQQLPQAKTQVVERKRALQQFQEQHQIFLADEEAQYNVGNMRNLSQQIQDVTSQLQEVRVRTQELEGQIGMNSQQALALNKLSHSPAIQQDIENLQVAYSQLIVERERYHDSHPVIVGLQERIAAFEDSLQQHMEGVLGTSAQFALENLLASERENLPQRLTSELAESEIQEKRLISQLNHLTNIRETAQQKFAQVPQLLNQFEDLQLQLETAQSKYKFLLGQAQELSLLQQQNFDHVRVVESAQAIAPDIRSSFLLTIVVGGFIGTIVAISSMATADMMDKRVKSPEELEQIYALKILGHIPIFDSQIQPHDIHNSIVRDKFALTTPRIQSEDSQLLVRERPITSAKMLPIKELPLSTSSGAFWMLQAKFKSLDLEQADKVFVVSSALPNEGKSTVTANLALALSLLGQKILIIDGNLHCPTQHKIWSGENTLGLSEIILGREPIDSAIKPVAKNLDLVSAGTVRSDPLAITNSQTTKDLLNYLVYQYDFIFIDSPALNQVPDALGWAELADKMILVAKLGTIDYQSAHQCRELLEITGIDAVELVVNGCT